MKRLLLVMALAVSVPGLAAFGGMTVPAANGGIIQELDAADQLERQLDRRNRSVTWLATCRQVSRRTFTCKFSGYRRSTFYNGRASCRKLSRTRYRCRILSYRTS
jgi:hypothetical protein